MGSQVTSTRLGSLNLSGDTPDLQPSRYMSGESDDDSAHATPTDMTAAAPNSPRESWPNAKMPSEEVRKIHYIDTATTTSAPTLVPSPVRANPGSQAIVTVSTTAATTAPQAIPSEARMTASTSTSNPASAASTPASTPGATPQSYARRRGRPRKHPLADPNPALKTKRKLSADSTASVAKKKFNSAAASAARSAAYTAGSLLSVPDLGRLIPQGSSSENAQTFIQNNLRLFADLFVALQKQASTDNIVRDEATAELNGLTDVHVDQSSIVQQPDSSADHLAPANFPAAAIASQPTTSQSQNNAGVGIGASAHGSVASPNKIAGSSDDIRDEIKKKMADVAEGRRAIQDEMLQMRVDASFFENAQKTVDQRIVVLRDRIAKHTALLQREREATRKAREVTRQAKKDRKAREKSLRDSEREERRLAQTFMQLERDIAAEEEERRRLEEADSSDEEDNVAPPAASVGTLGQLEGFDTFTVDASPSEATTVSDTATSPLNHNTVATADRAIGFSDEELAKVLGISTGELAGFSQTLDFTSLEPPSALNNRSQADSATPFASILTSDQPDVQLGTDANTDSFDVAAFLDMASSFGAVATATTQQDENP
ncbi:uncharacterized protein MEPE_02535 [Melanopsichium pennsylvanicum]|uniref:Uncharacterized protein n=2 Tax=Melanopsichium pennsylvanicum TaxID=63383 RepID=A0AAJ4XK67_9BASI|nr:putative protein [Melanopsichium pennsylvanicum 4]SNX83827.1 uncharacterized protein MEPE_02535 [Melanopsichium pennsylvanicum]